ncbi:GNAT family N-acetyltransferase [Porphyromonas cangingivalis]|uniref:Acetyltransferase (GNAT) domain-containing protein n=1 Tax=Porphyromonas cangingivalis TaxID=36874 RepID=A0A1T4JZE4_PORCN|nr:GNAT family N-acetyltransferase [Porphyromonas cangingivalis]SJZ35622.1 Acetyltransferase (GNAT) domain-containing protein [Porphyromonas cangingivalis]VEJ03269.1 Predicted acetyltransferase involved in intracellular survival and related acetyltransferases [Porphyromonas cangingivalis]
MSPSYHFRRYNPADKVQEKALLALLVEAFGAYEPYYEAQLSLVADAESTLLYYAEGDELVAHIQVVPYEATTAQGKRLKVAYLYAICTAKKFQGQGIMGKMLRETLAQLPTMGYDVAALVPAEESLIGYYRPFGFEMMTGGTPPSVASATVPIVRAGKGAKVFNRRSHELDIELYGSSEPKPLVGWMLHPLSATTLPLPLDTPIEAPMV